MECISTIIAHMTPDALRIGFAVGILGCTLLGRRLRLYPILSTIGILTIAAFSGYILGKKY
jgi:hypothetical protein